MESIADEPARWELQIADLERRIVEQKRRVSSEGASFGSLEVLHVMEQTLESWREQRRVLQYRL
jgi:hypothetical protein